MQWVQAVLAWDGLNWPTPPPGGRKWVTGFDPGFFKKKKIRYLGKVCQVEWHIFFPHTPPWKATVPPCGPLTLCSSHILFMLCHGGGLSKHGQEMGNNFGLTQIKLVVHRSKMDSEDVLINEFNSSVCYLFQLACKAQTDNPIEVCFGVVHVLTLPFLFLFLHDVLLSLKEPPFGCWGIGVDGCGFFRAIEKCVCCFALFNFWLNFRVCACFFVVPPFFFAISGVKMTKNDKNQKNEQII